MKNRTAAKQEARHLQMDLWTDILVRVPAKDLPRMKLVCKSWHALITRSPSFARSHIDHWRSRVCPGFVACWRSRISYLTFESARDGCGVDGLLNFSIRSCQCENRQKEYPVVLGSCDALLLLRCPQCRQLEICNPVKGLRTKLPPPPSAALLGTHKEFHIVPDTASAGRYKILALTFQGGLHFTHPREGRCLGSRVRCWCYCFHRFDEPHKGKQSGWKELYMHWLKGRWKMDETIHRGGKIQILFSGHKYDHTTYSRMRLLSLDITKDEGFREYPFEPRPRGSSSSPSCTRRRSAWNGEFYYFEVDHEFRLWELENLDGELPRWIPRLSVPFGIPSHRNIYAGRETLLVVDGTRLIFGFGDTKFYVYDRILKEWGSVETDRKYADADKFLPHVYRSSIWGIDWV